MVFSSIIESDSTAYTHTGKKDPLQKPQPNPNTPLQIPTPAQISSKERILQKGTPFFWSPTSSNSRIPLGTAEIGVSLSSFFAHTHLPTQHNSTETRTRAFHTTLPLTALIKIFNNESYIINLTPSSNKKWHAAILLKPSSTTKTTLKAWCHALITARALCDCGELTGTSRMSLSSDVVLGYISEGLERLNEGGRFDGYLEGLREVGWDVDIGALEVRAGRRVFVE